MPLKQGLRVYFKETEGLFCKNADDVRPEAIAALLVGKDKDKDKDKDKEIKIKIKIKIGSNK